MCWVLAPLSRCKIGPDDCVKKAIVLLPGENRCARGKKPMILGDDHFE
jgi:hypothetical protein